jgi:hypothetical protein
MKRLFLTRILRVLRHAPYLCVLPLHQSLVPASSGMVIAILFCGSKLIGTWSRQLLSVAQSPAHLNTAPSRN